MAITNLHLVMFPWFAFGHISPFINLSNKLAIHGVRITFFSASANIPRIRPSLHPDAQIVSLTLPPVDGLPPGVESTSCSTPHQAELLKVAMDLMQPQIRDLLSALKPNFVVFDFTQYWLPKMASELGIKSCFYSVFMTSWLASLTVPARRPDPATCPSVDDLRLPPSGFPATSITSVPEFQARDFAYVFTSFHGKPRASDRLVSGLTNCSVIIAKTCYQMEAPYIDYVKSQFQKPFLVAGPMLPSNWFSPQTVPLDKKWETWLLQFAPKSVVFCSFGSETFLTSNQIEELALGLELTSLPFVIVVNSPGKSEDEIKQSLPPGFVNRVKDRGIISSGWVQQEQILAHPNVGCHVNHAGFSSIIEAMVNECQLVMLPQKGDQFLNSKLVSGDMGAGVEVERRDEDGGFDREMVRKAVESVMIRVDEEPGKTIREKWRKWREMLVDEGFEKRLIQDLVKDLEALI